VGTSCHCLIIPHGIRDRPCEEGCCSPIEEAGTAAGAVSAVRREAWDLLILDVARPDRHGLEVLKEVNLLRSTLLIPIPRA